MSDFSLAIGVLRTRRDEIREEEGFTPATAKAENELTEAIELLLENHG